MAENKVRHLLHRRSNVANSRQINIENRGDESRVNRGVLTVEAPKSPTSSNIEFGEIAINYKKGSEAIFIRNSANEIVQLNTIQNIRYEGDDKAVDPSLKQYLDDRYVNASGDTMYGTLRIEKDLDSDDPQLIYRGSLVDISATTTNIKGDTLVIDETNTISLTSPTATINSKTTINNDLTVTGDINVSGNTTLENLTIGDGALTLSSITILDKIELVGVIVPPASSTTITLGTKSCSNAAADYTINLNGNVNVCQDMVVGKNFSAISETSVYGQTNLQGAVTLHNNLTVANRTNITGATTMGSTLTVNGTATFNGATTTTSLSANTTNGTTTLAALESKKALTVNGKTTVSGNTTMSSTLGVSGNATISGATTATSLTVANTGTAAFNGGLTVNSNMTVNGATTVGASGGSLTTPALTVNGQITATGAIYSSDIVLKENLNNISDNDINAVSKVSLKCYNFKDDVNKTQKYGVVAQDLQNVGLGNLVHMSNETLGVDYISFLVLKIAQLEKRIEELENK